MKSKRPAIGTKMYSVHEHRYYVKDKVAPVLEYCVGEAEVTGFYEGGYTEVCLTGKSPEGYRTPYRYKLGDIGKRIFYTAREAAELAETMTEKYEHIWGWIGAPDIPMRRTWEKFLTDTDMETGVLEKKTRAVQMSLFDLPEVMP